MGSMRRRTFLAAGGLGGLGIIGALSVHDPTILREVAVRNRTRHTWRVGVRVMADGDVMTEQTHELEPQEQRQVSCEWPSSARTFHLGARLESDAGWRYYQPISSSGDHCRLLEIVYDTQTEHDTGPVVVMRRDNPCPPTEAEPDRTACDISRRDRIFRVL